MKTSDQRMRAAAAFATTLILLSLVAAVQSSEVAKKATVDVFGMLTKLPPPPKGHARIGRATISGSVEPTLIQSDGAFVLANVPLGSYAVTIEFDDIVWPLIRIDVTEGRHGALRIRASTNDVVGSSTTLHGGEDQSSPIEVPPVGRHGYYVPREEFSPMSFLKNPMMLMMVVSMAMFGVMKLVPQDELRQQMKELSQVTKEGPAAIAKKKE